MSELLSRRNFLTLVAGATVGIATSKLLGELKAEPSIQETPLIDIVWEKNLSNVSDYLEVILVYLHDVVNYGKQPLPEGAERIELKFISDDILSMSFDQTGSHTFIGKEEIEKNKFLNKITAEVNKIRNIRIHVDYPNWEGGTDQAISISRKKSLSITSYDRPLKKNFRDIFKSGNKMIAYRNIIHSVSVDHKVEKVHDSLTTLNHDGYESLVRLFNPTETLLS